MDSFVKSYITIDLSVYAAMPDSLLNQQDAYESFFKLPPVNIFI